MGKKRPRASGKQVAKKRRVAGRPYLKALLAAVAIALLMRAAVVQPFRIPSRSMEDSLLAGDCLLVDKLVYGARLPFAQVRLPGWSEPGRGDVVVFRFPEDTRRLYVKRCIATTGQVVEIRNKVVYVDGQRVPDPPYSKYVDVRILPVEKAPRDNYGPQLVPHGSIFVLGDNRDNSRDSRHWGLLDTELIVGKGRCVYWSCSPDKRGAGEVAWMESVIDLPARIRWNRIGAWVR